MLNVVFIITGMKSGGAERQLLNLVHFLKKYLWIKITVVVLSERGFYSDRLDSLDVEVVYLNLYSFRGLINIFQLTKLIKEKYKDQKSLVISSWLYDADFVTVIISMMFGFKVPVIWNVRTAEISKSYGFRIYFILKILRAFSGIVPSKIVYNSLRGRAVHCDFGYSCENDIVIRNSFSVESYISDFKKQKCARKNTIKIGFIGRYSPQKGFDVLLESLNLISSSDQKFELVVAGFSLDDVSDEDRIKVARLNNVIFLGQLDKTALSRFYQSIDVVVLPSLYGEGVPNVILEALYFNKYVIGTNVGDVADLLSDERGTVVEKSDPVALCGAFRQFSKNINNTLIDTRGYVVNNFDLKKQSLLYLSVLKDFLRV